MERTNDRNATAAILVLRAFFAQFWLLQMIGKARDQESGITSLHNLSIWAKNVGEWMVKTTPLPSWAVTPFVTGLPFVECALGLLFLVGFQTRRALIASTLVIVSLDIGLMFQLKHENVTSNLILILAALIGLRWEPWNRWSVDSLVSGRAGA